MREILIIAGGAISVLGVLPYLRDVIRGKTKPRVVSWLTWTVLTAIATGAALSDKAYASGILTLAGTLATGSVVLAGLKYGDKKFERFDIFCLTGALVGLVLWLTFGSPEIAIIATVTIDFIGAMPTLRHSWQKPHEETEQAFIISSFAAFLSLLAVEHISITNLAFPLYLTLMNATIASVVVTRKRVEVGE
jgi:hypothetical protein